MSAPSPALAARAAALAVVEAARRQPALRVPLDDALGLILAEEVIAPIDLPPHRTSSMDGYAARAADIRGASRERPATLTVIGEAAPGRGAAGPVAPGQCVRVFTGGGIPEGADSVVRQEDTDLGRDEVRIVDDRDALANIRQPGEALTRGACAVAAGTPLTAAHLGVLAAVACAAPVVVRRPRVALLCSGDEVVDVDRPEEILSGRRVGSANTHSLLALTREAGGEPMDLGIAADTQASVQAHLARAADADLVVTAGGVSVGAHDHLRDAVVASGGTIAFWRARIRPGGPVAFGHLGEALWLGLPGNPVSAMVTFELFVRPAIRKMAGHRDPFRRPRTVRTATAISLAARLQHFLRAVVTEEGEGPIARLTGPQGSGILASMAAANALLVIPEGQQETPAGASLQALMLDEPRHQEEPGF